MYTYVYMYIPADGPAPWRAPGNELDAPPLVLSRALAPPRRPSGSGCRVQGSGFRVQGSGFRVQGSGFRVQGSGFRVQGSGFGVQGCRPSGREPLVCLVFLTLVTGPRRSLRVLSCVIQASMRLQYEPASEPLHIHVQCEPSPTFSSS